ncbi:hypothetical protein PIB30_105956 [Stylosanthes scabra]|uniref:Uncharacterized protein n=1 Tax=Stylosanthes scabra TaxID=79078 RepID=A0ABU6YZE3_9FABA|nr:hypothetical protein [Stylosanthes scabra]
MYEKDVGRCNRVNGMQNKNFAREFWSQREEGVTFTPRLEQGQTWVKRGGRRMRGGWGGGVLATFGTWLGQVQTWHGLVKGSVLGKGEYHVGTTFGTWPKRGGVC